jgi:hypothetical protein
MGVKHISETLYKSALVVIREKTRKFLPDQEKNWLQFSGVINCGHNKALALKFQARGYR